MITTACARPPLREILGTCVVPVVDLLYYRRLRLMRQAIDGASTRTGWEKAQALARMEQIAYARKKSMGVGGVESPAMSKIWRGLKISSVSALFEAVEESLKGDDLMATEAASRFLSHAEFFDRTGHAVAPAQQMAARLAERVAKPNGMLVRTMFPYWWQEGVKAGMEEIASASLQTIYWQVLMESLHEARAPKGDFYHFVNGMLTR